MSPGTVSDPAIGVDIGGTGIKGAHVDVETGTLVTERIRLLTPSPATPDCGGRGRRAPPGADRR